MAGFAAEYCTIWEAVVANCPGFIYFCGVYRPFLLCFSTSSLLLSVNLVSDPHPFTLNSAFDGWGGPSSGVVYLVRLAYEWLYGNPLVWHRVNPVILKKWNGVRLIFPSGYAFDFSWDFYSFFSPGGVWHHDLHHSVNTGNYGIKRACEFLYS